MIRMFKPLFVQLCGRYHCHIYQSVFNPDIVIPLFLQKRMRKSAFWRKDNFKNSEFKKRQRGYWLYSSFSGGLDLSYLFVCFSLSVHLG